MINKEKDECTQAKSNAVLCFSKIGFLYKADDLSHKRHYLVKELK